MRECVPFGILLLFCVLWALGLVAAYRLGYSSGRRREWREREK
jgi:hypothetical protein